MRELFEIKQNLSLLELYSASIYFALRNKKLVKFFYLIPGIILVSSVSSIFLSPKANHKWPFILLQIFIPVMFIVVFFVIMIMLICALLLLFKPDNFRNNTYVFNHWGVSKNGKRTDYSAPWRNFTKWKETKSFILIYLSDSDAHIIQKRLFTSPEEIEEFRAFINTKLKKA